jgi:TonB-dependent starch-binding outer membrane protein SusC
MEIFTKVKGRKLIWAALLLLLLVHGNSYGQNFTVSGSVIDEDGVALPGVNVLVKGTTSGTATDSQGRYSISAPDGNVTLVFSFVGYTSHEEAVSNRSTIDVQLSPDIQSLSEVVVIGYGTQKRETVTGSIATIKASEFNAGQINDPLTLISGKVAGLAVSNANRSDPNATADFSLRGPATVEGNSQPLVVIDGVPGGSLQTIAPGDIASIDVLKDGSAAAIYGSRATAGVIIVTTKKGEAGKTRLNYSGYVTTDRIAKKYDVLNAAQYRQVAQENGFAEDDAGADTDWFDAVTRTPVSHTHNLSFTGGTENTTYYASLNYRKMNGMDLRGEREFVNGTFRLNTKALNDKLDFSFMLVNSYDDRNFANYGAIAQSLNMNPTYPVRNPDGTFYQRPDVPFGLQWNPVASTEHNTNNSKEKRFLSTATVAYHIMPSLTASLTYSLLKNDFLEGMYVSREDFFQQRDGIGGAASRGEMDETNNILEGTLSYTRQFNAHSFDVIAGYSYQNNFNEGFSAGNNNYNTDAFLYYNLGAGTALNNLTTNFNRSGVFLNSYANERTLVAYFGRIIYDFQERYLLNLSIRREGASVFGSENKWGTFYGISGGWVLSKENFLSDAVFLKNLKVRAGYGVTGNQESLSPYQSLASIGPFFGGTQNGFFGEPGNGRWILPYGPTINPNPQLQWETKKEVNAGIDFTLFESGWLSGSIDYYNRRIEDLVGNYAAQLPSQIHPNIFANAGLMENKGLEIMLDARIVNNENFKWGATLTTAYNRNEIVSVTSDQFKGTAHDITRVTEGTTIQRLAPGHPVAVFYGRVFAGFTDDGQWLFRNSDGEAVEASEIGEDDFAYLGNSIPKYTLGLTNTFTIGKFDVSLLIRSALGFNSVNGKRIFHENLTYFGRNNLFTSAIDDGIQAEPTFSSYYLEKGDFLKVDNLTIGYTLPIKKSNYLQNIRVYFTGANLLTFSGFSGTDPELGLNYFPPDDPAAEITDGPSVENNYSYYPSTRSFTFGINVSF